MELHDDEPRSASSLWRRAPWWRAAAIAATAATVGAAVLLSRAPNLQVATQVPGVSQPTTSAPSAAVLRVTPSAAPESNPNSVGSATNPSLESAASPLSAPPPTVSPAAVSQVSEDDEQIQAMCHPHLLTAPSMPQVDVLGVPSPNLAHMKIHFWVNGTGTVVRQQMTAASYGSPAEQQAEMAFVRQLTFSLPNTRECRTREVELVGDVFEARNASTQWETYVRLYPRYSFTNGGALMRRE